MEDREFNKIMNDYVSSTSSGKELDFKKLENTQKTKYKNKSSYFKWVLTISSVIIIVIMAIVIPFSIPTTQDNYNPTFCEEHDWITQVVDSVDVLKTYGFDKVDYPKLPIEKLSQSVYNLKEDLQEHIACDLKYSIYDEYYDEIIIKAVKRQYDFQNYKLLYDSCDKEITYNGQHFKYMVAENMFLQQYDYYFTYSTNDYKYYIEVKVYEDFEASEILDFIY